MFAFTAVLCTLANCTPEHIRLSDGPIYYPTAKTGGEPRSAGCIKARSYASKVDCDMAKWKPVRITRDGFCMEVKSVKAAAHYFGCTGPNVSSAIHRHGTVAGKDGLRYKVELVS